MLLQRLNLSFEYNCVKLIAPNQEPIPDQLGAFLDSKHKDLH